MFVPMETREDFLLKLATVVRVQTSVVPDVEVVSGHKPPSFEGEHRRNVRVFLFWRLQEAEVEAARSLANLAKDFATIRQDVSVEVRTEVERVFQAAFIFDRSRTKQ